MLVTAQMVSEWEELLVQPMNTSSHMKTQNENDRKEIKFNNLKGKMLLFGLMEEPFFL